MVSCPSPQGSQQEMLIEQTIQGHRGNRELPGAQDRETSQGGAPAAGGTHRLCTKNKV